MILMTKEDAANAARNLRILFPQAPTEAILADCILQNGLLETANAYQGLWEVLEFLAEWEVQA